MVDKETLGQYTKIVVETDEENPVTIAVIQSNSVDTINFRKSKRDMGTYCSTV